MPMMHKILRCILARHLQSGRKHERGSIAKTGVYVMDVCGCPRN